MKIKRLLKKKSLVITAAAVVVVAGAGASYALVKQYTPVHNANPTSSVEVTETPSPSTTPEVEETPAPTTSVSPSPSPSPSPTPTPSSTPSVSDEDVLKYIKNNVVSTKSQPVISVYLGTKGRNIDYKVLVEESNAFINKYPNLSGYSLSVQLLQHIIKLHP